ncbi:hypothetical protein ACQY0O_005401 [Thecaphora frezii]
MLRLVTSRRLLACLLLSLVIASSSALPVPSQGLHNNLVERSAAQQIAQDVLFDNHTLKIVHSWATNNVKYAKKIFGQNRSSEFLRTADKEHKFKVQGYKKNGSLMMFDLQYGDGLYSNGNIGKRGLPEGPTKSKHDDRTGHIKETSKNTTKKQAEEEHHKHLRAPSTKKPEYHGDASRGSGTEVASAASASKGGDERHKPHSHHLVKKDQEADPRQNERSPKRQSEDQGPDSDEKVRFHHARWPNPSSMKKKIANIHLQTFGNTLCYPECSSMYSTFWKRSITDGGSVMRADR